MQQSETATDLDERAYRIGELAKLSGLPVSTLRLWQERGFLGEKRSQGGHRLFADRDLRWVLQARDLTQGRYMTDELAATISALVESSRPEIKLGQPVPTRAPRHDPNYERMLDLAAQNARLFAEQRDLASRLSAVAEDLAVAEERYASTVQRIPQCLWSIEVERDKTLSLKLCTPAIESITGYPPSAFVERPEKWLEVVHPLDRDAVTESARRVSTGESVVLEHRIVRVDGSEAWVRNTATPTRGSDGSVTRADGSIAEVTERKLAEISLRASEEKLRLIVENFPDSIFTQDRQLRYTSAINPAFHSSEEVLGRTVWETLSAEEAEVLTRIKQGVIDTGEPARTVVKLTHRGQFRYFDMVIRPLRDVSGSIDGVVAYNRDITERVLAEQALHQEIEALRRQVEQ